MEGDLNSHKAFPAVVRISIHALRVEGDTGSKNLRPVRFISIHALRVEGDTRTQNKFNPTEISIHALRVEGDGAFATQEEGEKIFLSTPSGWRATPFMLLRMPPLRISIHALRVEGDSKNGQSFRLFLRKREKNLPL